MIEKQFNVFDVDGTIFLEDHKKGSYHIGEIGNVDVNCLNDIADRLNGLTAKNKVLYKEIERLKRQNEDILYNNAKNMELLEKKNEELKADNNRLVNETAKIVAEHQKKILDLIDEKIEEYSPKHKLYNTNAIEVLKELKKELIE